MVKYFHIFSASASINGERVALFHFNYCMHPAYSYSKQSVSLTTPLPHSNLFVSLPTRYISKLFLVAQ